MPKSAGRSGASHPMTVNETVIALIRPKPDLGRLTEQPTEAQAAARAAVDAPDGIGTLTSYATEVALPVKGDLEEPRDRQCPRRRRPDRAGSRGAAVVHRDSSVDTPAFRRGRNRTPAEQGRESRFAA
ncbi:hypothetical protein ABZ672_51700, partial [Streptomyces mirabilis]